MYTIVAVLLAFAPQGLALADPQITPAPQLRERQVDPAFVGYVDSNGNFNNPRTCDYPQTASTSGSYFQCCPTTGACPFYTACSSNTLIGGPTPVPCDVDPGLTCNTGVVKASTNAAGGAAYLACWQTALGTGAFTLIQDIGSATPSGGSSASASQSSAASGSASTTAASSTKSSSTSATSSQKTSTTGAASIASSGAAATSSSSKGVAAGLAAGANTGLVGLVAYVAQLLI
ncbi:hypothetical protein K461DRAFT_291280 [Myriangium duriaei CBS 260.36]|uniref:Uncharacterized protein n=1 Tax=Myriangium duriaei CBS 260.36 TaxID=1168546 RepID=A0A9P4JB04_9PEZI|nr:hypothetical protein K461DRAFT_291280 [Myriangium duriaei CBS 260.36]